MCDQPSKHRGKTKVFIPVPKQQSYHYSTNIPVHLRDLFENIFKQLQDASLEALWLRINFPKTIVKQLIFFSSQRSISLSPYKTTQVIITYFQVLHQQIYLHLVMTALMGCLQLLAQGVHCGFLVYLWHCKVEVAFQLRGEKGEKT